MVTIEQAARELYRAINAPAGRVNVLPVREGERGILRVWLAPGYPPPPGLVIPDEFEGFPVLVERRGEARADQRAH